MLIQTKHFGQIDLDEEKIIHFDNGIMGFEDYKKFTILYNNEKRDKPVISWLQSVDHADLALPVINPLFVREDYNPCVEDELLDAIGELTEENLVIFLTLTVPADITKMTSNLRAPIIINADTRRGCQIIVENQDYQVKYPVYEKFLQAKEGKTC